MASQAQFKLPVPNDLAGSAGWLLTLIPLLLLLAGCAVDPSRNELIDYRDGLRAGKKRCKRICRRIEPAGDRAQLRHATCG